MKEIKQNELVNDANARHLAIINSATDAIITIDSYGIIESVNHATVILFQYSEAEMIGQNVSMLMPSPYKQEHDRYIGAYLATHIPRIIGIGRVVHGQRKDGTIFPLRLAVSEVKLKDRVIFAGIIHDLTQVKQAESEILRLNQELSRQNDELEHKVEERTERLAAMLNDILENNRKLNSEIAERQRIEKILREREQTIQDALRKERELSELKSRFLSTASHEFRTPLSSVLSSAEILDMYAQKMENDKFAKHVARIKSSVSQLTSILNDFLSLSKLDEGKVKVNLELITLGNFCNEVLDEIKGLCKPGQEIIHASALEGQVITDKKILKNVLFNLLSNAIKYSPEGTKIECDSKIADGKLVFRVKDHGIGIPENDQPYLFGNFFRASNAENIQGTGLGLAIVKRYIELLHGTLTFSSKEGEGTEFTFHIPIHTEHPHG